MHLEEAVVEDVKAPSDSGVCSRHGSTFLPRGVKIPPEAPISFGAALRSHETFLLLFYTVKVYS
jgi:hypothetical protein